MTTYLTSDLHLGHEKVAHHRGFTTVDEHDRTILANIVNTLARDDRLWILGDISTGTKRSEQHALDQLNELTPFFELNLIAGNHDSCHPMHIASHIRQAKFAEVFNSVQTAARRRVPGIGRKVWFSHFPYFGAGDRDSTEDRHPEVRLHDNGSDYLLHGHLHTAQHWTGPRSLHIGLDAWDLRPVSLDHTIAMIFDREQELAAA